MQYYDRKITGTRIKEIRQLRGLTQRQLAEQLGYTSERQLQQIENGETSCSTDKLVEIAQILEITTDYLLLGTEKRCHSKFQRYFENKTEKQIEYLCKLLNAASENMELLYQ